MIEQHKVVSGRWDQLTDSQVQFVNLNAIHIGGNTVQFTAVFPDSVNIRGLNDTIMGRNS